LIPHFNSQNTNSDCNISSRRHPQGIPSKGVLLTQISSFWFDKLSTIIPNHVITTDFVHMPQDELAPYRAQLEGRCMFVRKAKVVKIEAIVRGYLTGVCFCVFAVLPRLALPPEGACIYLTFPLFYKVLPGRNTRKVAQCME
jgi:hypothetical protein